MAKRRAAGYGDSRRYYDWMGRAGEDLACAMLLLREDDCYNCIAFHCQQAIEKALKAYVLIKSGQLVDGHNLTWLCKRAARHDKDFTAWLDGSASLNRCYIETRYPADIPIRLQYDQVRDYCDLAKNMYAFICTEMDAMLEENGADPSEAED